MYTYIESYAKVLGKDGTVRFMHVARAFHALSTCSFFFFLLGFFFINTCSLSSPASLAPVSVVKVRVVIGNRIEFVLLPRTLASSSHVFTKLADWHRALLVLNA